MACASSIQASLARHLMTHPFVNAILNAVVSLRSRLLQCRGASLNFHNVPTCAVDILAVIVSQKPKKQPSEVPLSKSIKELSKALYDSVCSLCKAPGSHPLVGSTTDFVLLQTLFTLVTTLHE